MWILLFMVLPVIAGVIKYRQLDPIYSLLFYVCLIILINQVLFYFFKYLPGYELSPFWNNIFNYYTVLCWLPNFVFLAISWTRVKKPRAFSMAFFFICIAFILTDINYFGMQKIRASLALSMCRILAIFVFVYCFIDVLNQKLHKRVKLSRLFFIIPFLVISMYYITFDIFIFYLFSNETELIFKNLYDLFMALAALAYICYTLSLLLAPKREIFVWCLDFIKEHISKKAIEYKKSMSTNIYIWNFGTNYIFSL